MSRILIERVPGDLSTREEVEESLLVKTTGVVDNAHEYTTWVEYRVPGSDLVVHRSAHITIKELPAPLQGRLGTVGGAR